MPIQQSWVRASIWGSALATYLSLIAWGARGLRGSDQYWYATDLVMQREKGGAVSNYISPIAWSSPQWSPDQLPPPVHNVPVVHVAMAIDRLLNDEYLSWVVTDAMLACGSAVLVYLVAQSLASQTAATVAAALFLLSPQTIWYTMNPFMEQAMVFFSLLLVWGTLQTQKRPWLGVAVMSGASGMLAASRANMYLVVPLGVVLCAVMAARMKSVRWRIMWAYAVFSVCAYLVISARLPQYPWKDISAVLAGGTPADVNHLNWRLPFTFPQVDLPWPMLLEKAATNLPRAVISSRGLEVLMVTWALIALIFGLIAAPKQRNASLVKYWAVSFFGIYVLTSALFLPHYRYAAPLTAPALILAVSGAERVIGPRRPRVLAVVAAVSVAAIVAMSLVVAATHRSTSKSDLSAVAVAKRMLAYLPPGSTLYLAEWDDGIHRPLEQRLGSIQWAYLAAPRPVLSVARLNPTPCVPTEVVNSWNVTSILVSEAESLELVRDAFCDPDSVGDMYFKTLPRDDTYGKYKIISLVR